ncbi:Vacuolar morphogenesis protein 6, partial [Spiromyces aspiralis]
LAEDDGKNKEDSREQGEGKLVAPQERGEDVEATREEVGEKEEGADKAGGVASPLSGADTVVGFSDQVSTNLSSRKQVKERRRVVWRDALLHMMRYLTEHRRRIQKAVAEGRRELDYLVRIIDDDNTAAVEEGKAASRRQPKSSSNESISNAQSKETSPLFRFQLLSININTMAMAQVVDTTLLKLYIECSPSLIGSLLRVKNYCDIEESEKLLLLHKKYKELVDLYHGKGLHRKALQLLVEHSGDKDNREMYGTRPLIDYLQRLPASQFDLVLEYAGKTLQPRQPARADDSDDDDAGGESNSLPNYEQAIYLVFADGRPASLSFPRNKVATFLTQISPLYAACYLEHVIWEWSDTDASLHDIMALSLLQIVLGGGTDRAGIEQSAPAPDDEARLVEFLKASTHYTPEKVLLNLPPDRLFRERMYVLARLRQYQKALQLGVFCMRDLEFAEQFCKEHVDEFGGIYLMLLNILTSDPPSDLAEARLAGSEPLDVPGQRQSRLDFALHLIATYPSRFPIAETIQALPASTPLHKNFLAYFRSQLRVQDQHQRSTCILSNLGIAEQFQLRRHLKELQSTRVVITETSTCSHCLKRIGRNVAFAVLPGKSRPIHLSCWQRRKGAERKAAVTMAVAAGGHLDGGHTAGSSSS